MMFIQETMEEFGNSIIQHSQSRALNHKWEGVN